MGAAKSGGRDRRSIHVTEPVIEKDGAPKWLPSNLAGVSESDVDEYFVPAAGEPDFG